METSPRSVVRTHTPRQTSRPIYIPNRHSSRTTARTRRIPPPPFLGEGPTGQNTGGLRLSPLTNTKTGILSQAIWNNPLFSIKKSELKFQELWESHETVLIQDLIETDGSEYTYEKLWQYFTGGESADTHINYKGQTYTRNRIMTSWDKILESLPPDYWPTIHSRNAET